MPAEPVFKAMLASAKERSVAAWVSGIVLMAVVGIAGWQHLFSDTQQPPSVAQVSSSEQHVLITEKPKLPAEKPHTRPEQTPIPPQTKHASQTPHITQQKPQARHTQQVTLGKGSLFVQVGAFQERSKAKAMHQAMHQSYRRVKIVLKKGLHAVWVGPVQSRKEAETLKRDILKKHKIKGFIVSNIKKDAT